MTRDDGAHTSARGDTSPIHFQYPTGYDSRCGWCWLGATHTEDEHGRKVAAAE